MRWALAVALLVFAAGVCIQLFRIQAAIDFYQFWGIAKARASSVEPLGSPYGEHAARYASLLNQRADRSSDPRLKRVNALRRTIDPCATPLLYLAFAAMPGDFTSANIVYMIVQLAALVAAVTWLAALLGSELPTALSFAAAIAILYQPFQSEMAVGNVNSLQLLACAALLAWTRRGALATSGVWFAGALAAFVLFKPNLALVGLALGVWLACSIGWRRSWIVPLAAGLVALLLIEVSSWWFGTAKAWPEWLAFIRGGDHSKLADYPATKGNCSLVLLLHGDASLARGSTLPIVISLLMATSWLLATWLGRAPRSFAAALRARIEEPWLLVSSALLIGLAASPLVWFHYALLAIVPGLWLGIAGQKSRVIPLLAFSSLFVYSLSYSPCLSAFASSSVDPGHVAPLIALAWIPAWAALLWRLAQGTVETTTLHREPVLMSIER